MDVCRVCQGEITQVRRLAFPKAVTCSQECSAENTRAKLRAAGRRQARKRTLAPAMYLQALDLHQQAQELYRKAQVLYQASRVGGQGAISAPSSWWMKLKDKLLLRTSASSPAPEGDGDYLEAAAILQAGGIELSPPGFEEMVGRMKGQG